jgi:PAS domain S-box-containing protein
MPTEPPQPDPRVARPSASPPADAASAPRAGPLGRLPLQVIGLFVLAAATGVVAWSVGNQPLEMLVAATIVLLPALAAAAYLLYRQHRSGDATEQSLRNVQAQVSGIVESAMDPIISIDESQRVVLFNAAAEQAFGWPRRAVIGQPLDLLIPARFRSSHHAHVGAFAATGVTSRRMGGATSLVALRANGEEFPIEASISQHVEAGRKVLTVILRDITTRTRAERLLAQSEARLRGILDSAMDAVITIDEDQKIVLFNAAAERMFRCPQQEALGAPLAWFIPDRFRTAHGAHVKAFAATGVTTRRMAGSRVVTGLRRDGEEFPIDASISQLREEGGTFYTVVLRDVSERVRAHEALARSREELRELATAASSAREQEQARIARELHDELAQSLSTLKMDIALIRGARPAAEDGVLGKRLDRMEKQIDGTIAAMRRIAADLRPLALDDLGLLPAIEALVQDFERRTGIRCELAIGDEHLALPDAHATAVFRIVQESLTNVVKHARAKRVEIVVDADDEAVTVSVRDDGTGFAADGPRKPQSYGLLGIRERAYLLGGDMRVTTAPGEGTEIEVRLPVRVLEAAR